MPEPLLTDIEVFNLVAERKMTAEEGARLLYKPDSWWVRLLRALFG